MIPVPFDWMMVARFAAVLGVLAAGWYVVDAIGDQREQKVWDKINKAIEKTNVDVSKQSELDDKIAAIAEAARQKAIQRARMAALPRVPAICAASEEQAQALSQIR